VRIGTRWSNGSLEAVAAHDAEQLTVGRRDGQACEVALAHTLA